ncbi:MAG: P-II family nitrogen regulator [Leptospirales bacterium]
MKKLECYIKPSRVEKVLDELIKAGITGVSISHVKGHGTQLGYTEIYRGTKRKVSLLEKVRVDIVLSKTNVDKTIKLIADAAHTGEEGDGKIFVYPVEQAYRIRTGEKDKKAIS